MTNPQALQAEVEAEDTAAFVAAVQVGIEAANAGHTISYEDVSRWVLSWGTPDELAPPHQR